MYKINFKTNEYQPLVKSADSPKNAVINEIMSSIDGKTENIYSITSLYARLEELFGRKPIFNNSQVNTITSFDVNTLEPIIIPIQFNVKNNVNIKDIICSVVLLNKNDEITVPLSDIFEEYLTKNVKNCTMKIIKI